MLRVDHQTAVEQNGFLAREQSVRTNQAENIFRCGVVGVRHVQIHRRIVEVTALRLIGVGNDNREFCDQVDGLPHDIFQTGVIRIGIIGIQSERRYGQLVHNINAGGAHNHVLGEAVRQGAFLREQARKGIELLLIGQAAGEQQIRSFRKTEPVLRVKAVEQIVQIVTAINQTALNRLDLALVHHITVNVGDAGNAGENACAVRVAQTALDAVFAEHLRLNQVIILKLAA